MVIIIRQNDEVCLTQTQESYWFSYDNHWLNNFNKSGF